jgi:GNAT superfamily N-acetyltransferase
MTARVIQGSFVRGGPHLSGPMAQPQAMPRPPAAAYSALAPAAQSKSMPRPPGSPAPAFAARPPGPPVPAFAGRPPVAQRHGAADSFSVNPGQLGLASSGGRPLPEAVRGKMEAALGADFSNVRVYVGPQAERIGAIAFTVGSDIYFAPGRFQPDTAHGQQLLGHELAHVVQQRAGRVRNPLGSGLAVVQDHALEAEADRLGRHAAAHRVAAQAKMPPSAAQPLAPVRISPPIGIVPGSYRLTAGAGGHQVGSVMVHARDKSAVEVTDLGVDQTQRGHGIGRMLVASAARTGLQFGKSKVTLAAQDKGSGHLTQWYREMGFTQIGVNQRGFPQLEAPISRVLAGVAQNRPLATITKPTSVQPATESGLNKPEAMERFGRKFASREHQERNPMGSKKLWSNPDPTAHSPGLTEPQRRDKLLKYLNAELQKANVPKLKSIDADYTQDQYAGVFDHKTWTIKLYGGCDLTDPGKTDYDELVRTVYHESRHCEQRFRAARYLAADGWTAADIANEMDIPNDIAQKAKDRPLKDVKRFGRQNSKYAEASIWHSSFGKTGTRHQHQVKTLTDLGNNPNDPVVDAAYRALPEEADAYHVEDRAVDVVNKIRTAS